MLISFHYLLHISECIEDCGPCWCFWQYPMERLCGILLPLVHSRLHPYKNLSNNILLSERFNHLTFVHPSLSDRLCKSSVETYSEDKVFSLDDTLEEFYWPKQDCSLTVHELKQLKYFYSILFNTPRKRLEVRLSILLFVLHNMDYLLNKIFKFIRTSIQMVKNLDVSEQKMVI